MDLAVAEGGEFAVAGRKGGAAVEGGDEVVGFRGK